MSESESRGDEAPDEAMQHDANELEERIERLDDHIDDARGELADRKEDAGEGEPRADPGV